jgi:hypothetical protein
MQKSTYVIEEHLLKQSKYADTDLLTQLLERLSPEMVAQVIMDILAKQEVESTHAIDVMLCHMKKVLVERVNSGDCSDTDKQLLRQCLKLQKRLELYNLIKDGCEGTRCQEFVLQNDFILLCNQLFYHSENEPDQVLKHLMELQVHDIAANYPKLISILPLDRLSVEVINEILPPNRDSPSSFWKSLASIMAA